LIYGHKAILVLVGSPDALHEPRAIIIHERAIGTIFIVGMCVGICGLLMSAIWETIYGKFTAGLLIALLVICWGALLIASAG
jgi:hypothetical protein